VVNKLLGRPLEAAAFSVRQGPWEATVDDAAMSVLRYEGNVLCQTHDAWTVPYADTGLEVHGTEGSVMASVMKQDPIGDVFLRDASGLRDVDVPRRRDPYDVTLEAFAGAVGGEGEPMVGGVEGLWATAVALAVREAATLGRSIPVATQRGGQR
jgi:1,5-anhydro-D-fructose reductase (1,5-anhydro-D-mannitol-forming)